jgi:hypothetical protein
MHAYDESIEGKLLRGQVSASLLKGIYAGFKITVAHLQEHSFQQIREYLGQTFSGEVWRDPGFELLRDPLVEDRLSMRYEAARDLGKGLPSRW